MPDFLSFGKEQIEMIEERLPKGRRVVQVMLVLAVLSLAVFFVSYLYQHLFLPASAVAISLAHTGTVTRTQLQAILVGIVGFFIGWLIAKVLVHKFVLVGEQILESARKGVDISRNCVDLCEAMYKRLDSVESRIDELQKRIEGVGNGNL